MIFEIMGYIAVSFLPLSIPLAAYFGAVYTFNKLSDDSELVAMRSFGLSKTKIFYPLFFVMLVVGFAMYSLNRNIIPVSMKKFKTELVKLTSKGVLNEIKAGQFFVEIPSITLFAENVEKDGTELSKVFIHKRENQSSAFQSIMAEKGELIKEQESEDEVPTLTLQLRNGNMVKVDQHGTEIEKILFAEYEFPIFDQNMKYDFMTKDDMRTSSELRSYIALSESRLQKLKDSKKPQDEKGYDSAYYVSTIYKSKLEFWSRMNIVLQILIFVLIGFCSGIKKGRDRTNYAGLKGFAIIMIYYILFFTGVSLTKKGQLMPEITVFAPTLIALLLSLKMFKNLDWS